MKRTSFASRYGRCLDVVAILNSKEDYNPTRPEESRENFQIFLNSLHAINNAETQVSREKKALTDARYVHFYNGQDSVQRFFTALKSNIGWQYGFESSEFKTLDIIWGRMISSGLVSQNAGEISNSAEMPVTEGKKSRRNSEKTYASMTKNFEDFTITITGFQNYNPGPEKFKLENLNTKLATIFNLNSEIAEKKLQLTMIKKERLLKYKELKDRTDRIKSNIKSQYGADSDVYILISSLDFSA
jgi:hypothetical protein